MKRIDLTQPQIDELNAALRRNHECAVDVPGGRLLFTLDVPAGATVTRGRVRIFDPRSYRFWRRLMWLPQPVYYWLLDLLTDNDGWRPMSYRERRRSP